MTPLSNLNITGLATVASAHADAPQTENHFKRKSTERSEIFSLDTLTRLGSGYNKKSRIAIGITLRRETQ